MRLRREPSVSVRKSSALCDRGWWGVTLFLAGALVLLATTAAWAVGELTQKPGTAGCSRRRCPAPPASSAGRSTARSASPRAPTAGASTPPRWSPTRSRSSTAIRPVGWRRRRARSVASRSTAAPSGRERARRRLRRGRERGRQEFYVTSSNSDAVAVFERDPATGALAQKADPEGCYVQNGSPGIGCLGGNGLGAAAGVAVSPTARASTSPATCPTRSRSSSVTRRPGR